MPVDDDIKAFKSWSMSLGCPPESIPCDRTLTKLFNSRHMFVLTNLLEKVKPNHEVKVIRQNILLNSMKSYQSSVITLRTTASTPPEYQLFLTINELNTKIQETEKRIEDNKNDYEKNHKAIMEQNNQIQNLSNRLEWNQMRSSIFYSKQKLIQKHLNDENETNRKILTIMPVQMKNIGANDCKPRLAISKCIAELKEFYQITNENTDSITADNFWQNMTEQFLNIPNVLLWNEINHIKDEQLQAESKRVDIKTDLIQPNRTKITVFSTALAKAHAKHISLRIDIKSLTNENEKLKQLYVPLYTKFINNVAQQMSLNNENEEQLEDTLNDFFIQFSLNIFANGQYEGIKQELIGKENLVKTRQKIVDDHHIVIATLEEKYKEIETLIVNTQSDIDALQLIKDKIIHCEKYTKYLIQNANHNDSDKLLKNTNSMESLLNGSQFNSFNSISESVLCSTKLEMDNTIRRENRNPKIVLRQHVNEISLLMDVPNQQFSELSAENQLALTNKTINFDQIQISGRPSMAHLIFQYFPLLNVLLKELPNKKEFHQQLEQLPNENINTVSLPNVDTKSFKEKQSSHINRIEEIFDKIDAIHTDTNRTIVDIHKYFNFLLKNPLKQFIPKTKLFNGRAFDEYEQEFLIQYSILKNKMSQ